MTTTVMIFSLFYFAVSLCFVFRTSEFVSAGITIESLFHWYLKSEYENFILYHIKRTTLTFLIHSILPLGYLLGVSAIADAEVSVLQLSSIWWTALSLFAVILPSFSCAAACYWLKDDWASHPIVKTLKLFCDNTSWRALSSDINIEFRRIDKITLKTSSITTVVVTDNWLIKVSPYGLNMTHQSDCVLVLCSADTHQVSVDGLGTVQYVNIEVKSTRGGVRPFYIRCNALDLRDLQDRVRRPISILQGITFHKTRIEQFLDVFRETINDNPPYSLPVAGEDTEMCIGCMVVPSNVKLLKCCDGPCTNCYCRPLWCVDCMGKWFASRQEQERPETWLSSNCTCPICRSLFCILDVCPVQTTS